MHTILSRSLCHSSCNDSIKLDRARCALPSMFWRSAHSHLPWTSDFSCRRAGTDVGDILHASQRLAHAQSERQATACRLLPPVHWALLYTIGALFVSTFILFETGGSFSNEGRHILFTVLCGLMSFVLVVSHWQMNSHQEVADRITLKGCPKL